MENLETYLHEELLKYDDYYQDLCESEQDEIMEAFKGTLAGHSLVVKFHIVQVFKEVVGGLLKMIFRRR